MLPDVVADFGEFYLEPETVNDDLFTDYNTYRISPKDNNIIWYSNCTPTDFASNGIMISNGLELGYSVINPKFSGVSNCEFKNISENAFPVVFPFKRDNNREISANSLSIFSTLIILLNHCNYLVLLI